MTTPDRKPLFGKPSLGKRTLTLGSSFAAGAMMLSHMNRSAVTRFDDMIADLARFHPGSAPVKRADRPLRDRSMPTAWPHR